MHKNKSPILAFSLAAVLLFIGTQLRWLIWVEKGACSRDTTLRIALDPEKDEPELLFKMGLPPGKDKTAPYGPASLEKYWQGLVHLCSLYEGLKSRSPPTPLYN